MDLLKNPDDIIRQLTKIGNIPMIREPEKVIMVLQRIKELPGVVEKNILEEIETDEEISVEDYFNFLVTVSINKTADRTIIKAMLKKIKTYEQAKMAMALVIKKRKEAYYQDLLVDEMRKPEIRIPHEAWMMLMTSSDPWYIFHSYKIKRLILEKCLETSRSPEEIIEVFECEKSFSLNGDLVDILDEMKIDKGWWKTIKAKSSVKEVQNLAAKRIKT